MRDFKFVCSLCQHRIQTRTIYAGELIACPVCEGEIVIPDPPQASDSPLPVAYPPGKQPPPARKPSTASFISGLKPDAYDFAPPMAPATSDLGEPTEKAADTIPEETAAKSAPTEGPSVPRETEEEPDSEVRPSESAPTGAEEAVPSAPEAEERRPESPEVSSATSDVVKPEAPAPTAEPPEVARAPSSWRPEPPPEVPLEEPTLPGEPEPSPAELSPPSPEVPAGSSAAIAPGDPDLETSSVERQEGRDERSGTAVPASSVPDHGARVPGPAPGRPVTARSPGSSPFAPPPAAEAPRAAVERSGPHTGVLILAANALVILIVAVVLMLPKRPSDLEATGEGRGQQRPTGLPAWTPIAPAEPTLEPVAVQQMQAAVGGFVTALGRADLLGAARWVTPTVSLETVTNELAAIVMAFEGSTTNDWRWSDPARTTNAIYAITIKPSDPGGDGQARIELREVPVGWRVVAIKLTPPAGATNATSVNVSFLSPSNEP